MSGVKVHIYKGRERFHAYLDAVRSYEGATVSPGGAAAILGVTRQRIHQLMKAGRLESWLFYDGERGNRPSYCEISVADCHQYVKECGRGMTEEEKRQLDTVKDDVLG